MYVSRSRAPKPCVHPLVILARLPVLALIPPSLAGPACRRDNEFDQGAEQQLRTAWDAVPSRKAIGGLGGLFL